jgi:hypothetical protein
MFYGDVVAVSRTPTYNEGTPRRRACCSTRWTTSAAFSAAVAMHPAADRTATDDIHYSQLQSNYRLISNCKVVDPNAFKPGAWDEATKGAWDPGFDGHRAGRGPVHALPSAGRRLHRTGGSRVGAATKRQHAAATGGPGRGKRPVRFPYGFATDRWADLGNLSVYRHDNGADPMSSSTSSSRSRKSTTSSTTTAAAAGLQRALAPRTVASAATTRSCVMPPRAWASANIYATSPVDAGLRLRPPLADAGHRAVSENLLVPASRSTTSRAARPSPSGRPLHARGRACCVQPRR